MSIGVPSRRLLLALGATALLLAFGGPAAWVVATVAAALLALAAFDAWLARAERGFTLRVEAPASLSQRERASAAVFGENRGARPLRLQLALDLSPGLATEQSQLAPRVTVAAREQATVSFELLAQSRGLHELEQLHVRRLGPLGLWWRQERRALRHAIEVLPVFARTRRPLRQAVRLRAAGVHAVRRRGDHGEFEALREYVRGDDPRRIDWKATARRSSLIVRNFQDERSQSVMLVIDAGRLMLDRVEGLRRIDWAAAAAAALADATRTWHDAVGVMVFSDVVHALVPPGQHPPDRIPRILALAQAKPVEPDYPRALVTLSRALRRRSLIVLLSDVIDSEVSAPVAAHVRQLAHRHLPLFVALRDPALDAQSLAPVADELALVRRAAATELLLARRRALESMRRHGIQVLDALPSASIEAAVEHYARVKQRGQL